jgi:hypothetical protein
LLESQAQRADPLGNTHFSSFSKPHRGGTLKPSNIQECRRDAAWKKLGIRFTKRAGTLCL